MDKKSNLANYNIKDVIAMMHAADFLEAPQDILSELAVHLIGHEKECDTQDLSIVRNNIYSPNTIMRLLESKAIQSNPVEIRYDNRSNSFSNDCCMRINDLGLQSLDGLEKLCSNQKLNTRINVVELQNNQLQALDLPLITRIFPNAWKIIMENNKIAKITKNDWAAIKDGMKLELTNNNITTIESSNRFDAPLSTTINLAQNPLSSKALENLTHSLQPSLYQKLRFNMHDQINAIGPSLSTVTVLVSAIFAGYRTASYIMPPMDQELLINAEVEYTKKISQLQELIDTSLKDFLTLGPEQKIKMAEALYAKTKIEEQGLDTLLSFKAGIAPFAAITVAFATVVAMISGVKWLSQYRFHPSTLQVDDGVSYDTLKAQEEQAEIKAALGLD